MAPTAKRSIVPRRRRADDDADEASVHGEADDESVSDESVLSDVVDGHDSDDEDEDLEVTKSRDDAKAATAPPLASPTAEGTASVPTFTTSAETTAMMNGLKLADEQKEEPELQFEATTESRAEDADSLHATKEIPTAPARENLAQKARREHQEYLKERDSNPAFVPNRGGFFLHDDRSSGTPGWVRPFGRGRGRGYGGVVPNGYVSESAVQMHDTDGRHRRVAPPVEPMNKPWAHDLHETHEITKNFPQQRPEASTAQKQTYPTSVSHKGAPNREFSFSTVLGNVNINVLLPGDEKRRTVPRLEKKHHVLLPTHRPPLRRDKPVRISIPEVEPSYRFPSVDRSFIFIPRAMRPNQQSFMRGRGRGSFHGSRRPSVVGSAYTPSVAMSRRSSFGGARDGRSPAGSVYGRQSMTGTEQVRPTVRMPGYVPMMTPGQGPMLYGYPYEAQQFQPMPPNIPVPHGVRSTAMPMHQPRPQKAVSISNIESPASLAVKAPQQQDQQPFHQQMPQYLAQHPPEAAVQQATGQPVSSSTPLSHIPEGAVYAQPFQPYPMMAPPIYYPTPYGNGTVFYPAMSEPMQNFNPNWADATYQRQALGPSNHYNAPAVNAAAHEQNGTVFYADPAMAQSVPGGQPGMMPMPMGAYGFYPMAPNFYPTQT